MMILTLQIWKNSKLPPTSLLNHSERPSRSNRVEKKLRFIPDGWCRAAVAWE